MTANAQDYSQKYIFEHSRKRRKAKSFKSSNKLREGKSGRSLNTSGIRLSQNVLKAASINLKFIR